MSGQYRGKIECVLAATSRNSLTQLVFKTIYDFFSSHPNYTIIALQYGTTSPLVTNSTTSGTGTGFYDAANSFGYNAFFVARANATAARPYDVYHLFQWTGSTSDGAPSLDISPGKPGRVDGLAAGTGNTLLGYACAIGIGGTGGSAGSPNNGNPWTGTQNVNGADTKGTWPIWNAPAGGGTGVIVFPRSDAGIATFASASQNMGGVYTTSNTTNQQTRLNIVADDDSFAIFYDETDNGNYTLGTYSGLYVPRPNTPVPTYPYMVITTTTALPLTFTGESVYGDQAGTATNQGGIVTPLSATVSSLQLDHFNAGNSTSGFLTDTNFWPDKQARPGGIFNEFPIAVGVFENSPVQLSGYLGFTDFLREMFNVTTNDTKSDFSRIFIGSTTLATSKLSVPWDAQNNTVPRSGASRAGTTFVTNI